MSIFFMACNEKSNTNEFGSIFNLNMISAINKITKIATKMADNMKADQRCLV